MINPIVLIILVAIVLSVFVVCIFIKPKKPILTATFLLILIVFVLCTVMIDNAISSPDMMDDFEKTMVSFITSTDINDTLRLEKSFDIFAYFDIGAFIATIIAMCVELKTILTMVYKEKSDSSAEGEKDSQPETDGDCHRGA